MSLLFSDITFCQKDGVKRSLYESGHPDEYDIRELLKTEDRYAFARASGLEGTIVQVQYYRFLGGSARDWLAEQEHLALIAAYEEMLPEWSFTQRDDVEHLEYYEFQINE